jgi:hypothetical protein
LYRPEVKHDRGNLPSVNFITIFLGLFRFVHRGMFPVWVVERMQQAYAFEADHENNINTKQS